MSANQSPIFSKSYDFILWLSNHTGRFPKSERFRLAKRLDDSAFAFYDLLLQAARSSHKQAHLEKADLELDRLRLYLRLSRDRGLTQPRQYEYAVKLLSEMGKLLGGWLKTCKN